MSGLLTREELDAVRRTQTDAFAGTPGEWQARSSVALSAAMRHIDALELAKAGAYAERNQCVALIARMALARGWLVGTGRHPDSDKTWEDDWRTILFINIPDVGQVSWHIHDAERHLLEGLPEYPTGWDGHSTEEKYRRMNAALALETTQKGAAHGQAETGDGRGRGQVHPVPQEDGPGDGRPAEGGGANKAGARSGGGVGEGAGEGVTAPPPPKGVMAILLLRFATMGAYVPELHLRAKDYDQVEAELAGVGMKRGPGQDILVETPLGGTRLIRRPVES